MCKRTTAEIVLLFLFSISAWSQAGDHTLEAYVQGSSANTNLLLGTSTSGFHAGAAWRPASPFGLVGDMGRQWGSIEGSKTSYTTIMAGPRLSSSERNGVSAFVQALGGVYRTSGHPLFPEETHWSYILSAGGGVDMRVIDHIAVRLLQIDLGLPRGQVSPVGIITVSAGIVLRFGH